MGVVRTAATSAFPAAALPKGPKTLGVLFPARSRRFLEGSGPLLPPEQAAAYARSGGCNNLPKLDLFGILRLLSLLCQLALHRFVSSI